MQLKLASCLPAARGLNSGDIDFLHCHHRVECALGLGPACCHCFGEHAWRDLPRYSPLVLAPPAFAFLTTIADYRVPIAVCFFLIVCRNHERKCLALFESVAAIQSDTRNAANSELYRKHVACLTAWKIRGRMKNGAYCAVRKGSSVKLRRSLRILLIPEANGILGLRTHMRHYIKSTIFQTLRRSTDGSF